MLDTEFIKKHIEHRDKIDRRSADSTQKVIIERRAADRRKPNPLECDIRFTPTQAAIILAVPVVLSAVLIFIILTR